MYVVEDYSEEILRRKEGLLDGILSDCVTANKLVDAALSQVYIELNVESCLERNWRGLAGKLLKPPPTSTDVQILAESRNRARELLKTWVSQSNGSKTFDSLIETMVECKVYSACDELLDFLENYENESGFDLKQRYEDLDKIVSCEVTDRSNKTSKFPENSTLSILKEQPQQNAGTRLEEIHPQRRSYVKQRSISCPAGGGWLSKFCKRVKKPFKRSKSSPATVYLLDPNPPTHITPPPPENEIFIVSSNTDRQTKGMKDLMSFIYKLKPVTKGALTVKTIHDVDQNGQMTTTWLEERVNRARFVILCFSSIMKAIADHKPGMPQFEHQMDYNLKFMMDFLVTGTIFHSVCRNPKGKFIPVLLPGHDLSTLIVPLRCFLHFSWPSEEERISKYIMNLPEYPVPHVGTPKRLVRKELC